MRIDQRAVRECLRTFDFQTIFIEHLGWDRHHASLAVLADGTTFELSSLAKKRGFVAFRLPSIPERRVRQKIEHQVAMSVREHFIVYADKEHRKQIWQWARREPGKPAAVREFTFDASMRGEDLIQRLEKIAVDFDEEESITLLDVAGRARAAFDVEKVTKKFYDRFKTEHVDFMRVVEGIQDTADLQWYTSLTLNRLMFVYFIQKKGFLDGDTDYLRNRLRRVRELKGEGKFHSFYRYFLLRLFHDGLGASPDERVLDSTLAKLLGDVPFLNGGFFEVHALEQRYQQIDIPDKAFESLFDFFDSYSWHLDERPLRADNEINPDVIGYIFEKYINQKQMGAYYTKEDITEYISKNCIVPFLFDAAKKNLSSALEPEASLWLALRATPERYIYASVRHGVLDGTGKILPLPSDIEAGVDDISKRTGWNRSADDPFALPAETWREHVARRRRCLEIREKLAKGDVRSIDDLVTLNLDIWQFARDAITGAEDPQLLRAFWQALQNLSVLDPTCGSGAFLFAALRILETLYGDCLERMKGFVASFSETEERHPKKFLDFREILGRIDEHPNERYFILKSSIINNLYGVDIMDEAVEICKLRLFLKLVAQVERVGQIEPLPDIDFNIRAGNTLVGFVSLQQLLASREGMLAFGEEEIRKIEEDAEIVERAFRQFRAQQTTHGGRVTHADKRALRDRLDSLNSRLDRWMAEGEYGIPKNERSFEAWKETHKPFHWFAEFYGIMRSGGFDVIIGNPPYVEYLKVARQYRIVGFSTESCGNLYAYVAERSVLISKSGRIGLITPISITAAQRMKPLQLLLKNTMHSLYFANFALRPASLFPGVMQRLTIILGSKGKPLASYTTDYITWYSEERTHLFQATIRFQTLEGLEQAYSFPKINNIIALNIFKKMITKQVKPDHASIFKGIYHIYYHNAGGYWIKTFNFKPHYKSLTTNNKNHTTVSKLCLISQDLMQVYLGVLNSSLFYFFWKTMTDARHLYPSDIAMFPVRVPFSKKNLNCLEELNQKLMRAYNQNCTRIIYGKAEVDQYSISPCKPIIDEIDRVLAEHYGFTDEELDFIINYDIKYRMGGAEDGGCDEDE